MAPYSSTAFVLGGGGARGALQVGALQALLEASIYPDLLVGTSIGAINAAYLAVRGVDLQTIQALGEVWCCAGRRNLLPTHPIHLALAAFFPNIIRSSLAQIRELLIENGIDPRLRFRDLRGIQLAVVTTDLLTGNPCLFGNVPNASADDTILDAVLASACLPPWLRPREHNGQVLADGGVVSGLPIQPTIQLGAREIFALDLCDPPAAWGHPNRWTIWQAVINRIIFSSMVREKELELLIAHLQGIHVHLLPLVGGQTGGIADFRFSPNLIQQGYAITRRTLQSEFALQEH